MRNSITTSTLVSQYQMLNHSRSKTKLVVFVEGASDIKFYQNYLSIRNCRLIDSNGKDNVKSTVSYLNSKKQKCYLGLIDSDFDNILGKPVLINLYRTDNHDVETDIIFAKQNYEVLQKIILSYIDPAKYDRYSTGIIKTIIELSYDIGLIKLYTMDKGLRLDLKEIDYSQILDAEMKYNRDKLYKDFLGQNYINFTNYLIVKNLNVISFENLVKPEQICNGHDLINISIFILSNYIGRSSKVPFKEIEQAVRVQYTKNEFEQTKMYTLLVQWINQNYSEDEILNNDYSNII
jgi:hypothetical protein